jgi:hypothetical protein
MSTLHDFADIDPPVLREVKPLTIVSGPARGKPLGFLAEGNRDAPIIIQRHRHPYEAGKQHFYRKLGGYTFPKRDIKRMSGIGVSEVIIQEVDNERVLEFGLHQYQNGAFGGVIDGDEQTGVPVDEAKHSWAAEKCTVVTKNSLTRKN